MRMGLKNFLIAAGLFAAIAAVSAPYIACGTQSDMIGGVTSWPVSGTKPWGKVDLDLKTEGLQPFIIQAPEGFDYVEPDLFNAKGYFWVFFERRAYEFVDGIKQPTGGDILVMRSTDAFTYELENDGAPVLTADRTWEDGFVGAPTILYEDGQFVMWYAGGIGRGIGRAVSEDGFNWEKTGGEPVLEADQAWEDGFIGAPSVIRHNGLDRMYYSGGRVNLTPFSLFAGRLIGYADSEDGVSWVKRDVDYRNSTDDGDKVETVFNPSQWWEGCGMDNECTGVEGAVASPSVLMTRQADRHVLLMFYTGNVPGNTVLYPTSIGVGAAFDYNDFTKASLEINPVVNENFALSLYGVSEYLTMSESGPSAIQLDWDFYMMTFSQTDPLSELGTAGRGIALATCPPMGSFME